MGEPIKAFFPNTSYFFLLRTKKFDKNKFFSYPSSVTSFFLLLLCLHLYPSSTNCFTHFSLRIHFFRFWAVGICFFRLFYYQFIILLLKNERIVKKGAKTTDVNNFFSRKKKIETNRFHQLGGNLR